MFPSVNINQRYIDRLTNGFIYISNPLSVHQRWWVINVFSLWIKYLRTHDSGLGRPQSLLYKRHPRTRFPLPTLNVLKYILSWCDTSLNSTLVFGSYFTDDIVAHGTCLIGRYSYTIILFVRHSAILSLNIEYQLSP